MLKMNLMPHKNKQIKNNDGFTLLEIIAVIVILGILGVVALPRYFNLQQQAREKAMGAGIAEAVGRVNGYFAQEVLGGSSPEEIKYTNETLGTDLGDFTLNTQEGVDSDGNQIITLTITGNAGTPIEGDTKQIIIPRPGL